MALHLLILAICVSSVNCLAFLAPRATKYADSHVDIKAWLPAPTTAPQLPHELLKRQISRLGLGSTVWKAPDRVFGYIEGDSERPYYCRESTEIAFLQPATKSSDFGVMGCCGDGYCRAVIDCVESDEYSSSCSGLPCETDTLTRKCTDVVAPYCRTVVMAGISVRGNACWSRPVYEVETVYRTPNEGTTVVVYSQIVFTQTTTSTSSTTTSTSESSSTTTSSPSTISPPVQTTSAAPNSTPTPIGPIVGGAIGGFAVLALVGFAIFFLINRHRKRKAKSTEEVDYSQNQPIQSPPIYVPQDGKPSPMQSQQAFTPMYDRSATASPLSGGGRESYMSGPGFDTPYSPSTLHEMAAAPKTGGR